jgi:hypothetical protein
VCVRMCVRAWPHEGQNSTMNGLLGCYGW